MRKFNVRFLGEKDVDGGRCVAMFRVAPTWHFWLRLQAAILCVSVAKWILGDVDEDTDA